MSATRVLVVAGRYTSSGTDHRGIAGATVSLRCGAFPARRVDGAPIPPAVTDSAGSFRFTGVPFPALAGVGAPYVVSVAGDAPPGSLTAGIAENDR